jgi:outer membrane protein assembly factor BamB
MMVLPVLLFATMAWAANTLSKPDDWPQWRGPNRDGVARGSAPLKWSEAENIAWKVAIPGKGHSSPVIWGDRLFLTTAVPLGEGGGGRTRGASLVEHEFTVLALDRKNGSVRWKRVAATETPHEGYHQRYGSFASNSPVTDGKRLYSSFGSRGVYAYDLDGKLLWKRMPDVKLRMRNGFGEGSATVVDADTVLLNFDQDGGGSFIWALDAATGKDRWRVPRDEVSTWSAPYVISHAGGKQVVLTGANKVRAYDYATGALIWECAGLGTNPIPMPVHLGDLLIVMTGHRQPNLLAIRLGRTGDLTGTDSIAWTNQRANSYTPSPVLADGKLYMLTDSGMLSCLDVRTEKPHYSQRRFGSAYNFKSSPVAANGNLYAASENEDVVVVRMGEQFEVLATNTMPGESFIATPAIAGGDLYLRSEKNLYCIREGKE